MRVLLVEPNDFHYEVIPGFAYYFDRLGYDVDVLMRPHEALGDEFCRCLQLKGSIGVYYHRGSNLKEALRELQERTCYDLLFFTSLEFFDGERFASVRRVFQDCDQSRMGIYGCSHSPHDLRANDDCDLSRQGRVVGLSPLNDEDVTYVEVNAHHFCDELAPHRKSAGVSVASIGFRVDRNDLERAAREVFERDGSLARLTFVRRGGRRIALVHGLKRIAVNALRLRGHAGSSQEPLGVVWLPRQVQREMTTLYNIPFEMLFDTIEGADFLACNIASMWEGNFAHGQTSGTKQLSLGFLKPCIIERRYAEAYGFSENNAVVYDEGRLAEALLRAAHMSSNEYDTLRDGLEALRADVEQRSLANLRGMLAG